MLKTGRGLSSISEVKAVFIGEDGSMGFHTGQEYRMWLFYRYGYFYMSRQSLYSIAIPYETMTALKKNWRLIL